MATALPYLCNKIIDDGRINYITINKENHLLFTRISKRFPMLNRVYTLIYTVADVFRVKECSIFTLQQLSILKCYFLTIYLMVAP